MKGQKKEFLRPRRVFSQDVKRGIVKDIESGRCSALSASRELGTSAQTIYRWIYQYSRHLQKNKVMVVEDQSESYRTKELEKQIKDLQAALGRKSMEVDYLNMLIEVAGKDLKVDLKKNFGQKSSPDSDNPKE